MMRTPSPYHLSSSSSSSPFSCSPLSLRLLVLHFLFPSLLLFLSFSLLSSSVPSLFLVSASPATTPSSSVIIYSWSDEWERRPADRWTTCGAGRLTCQLTWNESLYSLSSAFQIHAPDHRNESLPSHLLSDPQQRPLYYYTIEAPPWFTTPSFWSHFDQVSTYDLLSDAPRPYIVNPNLMELVRVKAFPFTVPGASVDLLNKLQQKRQYAIKVGSAPIAWFVSNCGADRSYYVAELMKYIPVDIYTSKHCLGSNLTLPARGEAEMKLLQSQYFFYLSLENHNCRDYVTEKLLRALKAGIVPIVDGPLDYSPFLPNGRRSALIVDDYATPRELADRISYLLSALDEYLQYLNFTSLHPAFIQANSRHYQGLCKLCEHAYTAKMQIQATGTYMRIPTRYRYTSDQLCIHGKWQQYNNEQTSIVTTERTGEYNGTKINAHQWWKQWIETPHTPNKKVNPPPPIINSTVPIISSISDSSYLLPSPMSFGSCSQLQQGLLMVSSNSAILLAVAVAVIEGVMLLIVLPRCRWHASGSHSGGVDMDGKDGKDGKDASVHSPYHYHAVPQSVIIRRTGHLYGHGDGEGNSASSGSRSD